jgi:sugar phosphate permease
MLAISPSYYIGRRYIIACFFLLSIAFENILGRFSEDNNPLVSFASLNTRGKFIYTLSIFLTSTAFVSTNAKIRHTSFEIYRIFENCPLGYNPIGSGFFI